MKSIEWYRNNYVDPRGVQTLHISADGNRLIVPLWLIVYILKKTGLKSKKKRIVKKVLKKEIEKLIESSVLIT